MIHFDLNNETFCDLHPSLTEETCYDVFQAAGVLYNMYKPLFENEIVCRHWNMPLTINKITL